MSATRDTGFLRNAIQVTNQGVTFVSGSTTLMSISSSGAVTTTGVISGSNALSASYSISGSYAVSSSYAFTASSATNAFNSISASYAYTASSATNATSASKAVSASYSDTASFSNNFTVLGNLTVYGTQSVQYITSSQLNISSNIITVNVGTPAIRFGGLSVYDSGSTAGATGSLFWDSQNNRWIYQQETGSTYTGGMLLSGPRNFGGLGNELGTTSGSLMKGQGGDHVTSSAIFEDGYKATVYTNALVVSSSGLVGIGTTNPGQPLELYVSDGSGMRLKNLGSSDKRWDLVVSGNDFRINETGVGAVISLKAGGNIGIGTTNPQAKLHVSGNMIIGSDGAYALISGPTTGAGISIGSNSATFDRNLYLGLVTAGLSFSPILTVNAQTSNVGIGVTDPSVTFNVGNSAHGVGMAYRGSSALPSVAGLFTSDGTGGGQTGYGSLLIKARTDYGGFYSLNFFTAASDNTPVERMRITSGGNVGIGTTSIVNANAKLEVKGDVFVTPLGGSASKLHLYNADSSNESYIYDAGGTSSSVITLAPAGSTSLTVGATSIAIASGRRLVINTDSNYQSLAQDLSFSSGIREIFRVPQNNLCTGGKFSIIGTGNSFVHSSQWMWNSTHNGGYGRCYIIQLTGGEYSNITMYADTTGGGDVIISANLGGAYTMQVVIEKTAGGAIDLTSQNGDRTSPVSGYQRVQSTTSIPYGSQFYSVVAATLGGSGNRALYSDSVGLITNSSSDVTLKKNVENIAYGLNSIMTLRPIAFNWIPENLGPQKEIGFIAQEVRQSIPELIGTNKDETLSLDYPKLTAVLTKAIQELKAENDSLKEILQRNNIN